MAKKLTDQNHLGGPEFNMAKRKFSTIRLVLYALFIALTLLLGLTPIGLIPLGFINVTILHIPTIIGTILLGWKAGLLFGGCFGLASFLSVCGLAMTPPSALAGALLAQSPILTIVMCFLPRLLIPITTHLVYQAFNRRAQKKAQKKSTFGVVPAAIVGTLTNTVFYLGLMLLFYVITGLESTTVLAIIGGTGLIAGASESVAAALIATPVVAALHKVKRI